MKLSLMCLVFLGLLSSVSANVVDHPTEIIVALKKGESLDKSNFTSAKDIKIIASESNKRGSLLHIELPMFLKSEQYLNDLKNHENVLWAEANPVFMGDPREYAPNDQLFLKQYHHKIIQSEKAWDVSTGVSEVIVAVTDDGFMLNHEDLKGSYYRNENEIPDNGIDDDNNGYVDDYIGWNFNENNNNADISGRHGNHGTHCAGIVGAEFNNGLGVVGHGPKIKVMPLKFYGKQRWTGSMIMEAYKYAADNGAKILTTSYNIDGMSKTEIYNEAVNYAYEKGMIIFNSAGNGNARQSARTKVTKVILVASTVSGSKVSEHDKRSNFSNYGVGVDIAAPGNPILSTGMNGDYITMSGTSMASPNAAGAAALIWSVNPQWNRMQVLAKLMTSSDDIDSKNSKYKNKLGNGRINIYRALAEDVIAPSIRQAWYDKYSKQLSFHVKGILDPNSFSRRGIILENNKGELFSGTLKSLNKYEMGTNILSFEVKAEPGSYRARILDNTFKGPFGNELDGDLDGIPGGEYILDFEVI